MDDFIIVGHIPLVVPIDRFPAKYTIFISHTPKVITMMNNKNRPQVFDVRLTNRTHPRAIAFGKEIEKWVGIS